MELGGNVLYEDTYIYERIDGLMHLSFMERKQVDDIVKTDFLNKLNNQKRSFNYVTRQFVRSFLPVNATKTYPNLYSPYQYNSDFWEQKNFIYKGEKEEQKIISDLESGGDTLEEQFRKNGQQK